MSAYADKAGETSRWVVKASDESLFLSYPYLNFPDKCRVNASENFPSFSQGMHVSRTVDDHPRNINVHWGTFNPTSLIVVD